MKGPFVGRTRELVYAQCTCMFSVRKMTDPMYGHQVRERSISATDQFQRKRHNFLTLPSLPAEYVAAFSQQAEASEVRCDLTDTHRQTDGNYCNPRCACARRVNDWLPKDKSGLIVDHRSWYGKFSLHPTIIAVL